MAGRHADHVLHLASIPSGLPPTHVVEAGRWIVFEVENFHQGLGELPLEEVQGRSTSLGAAQVGVGNDCAGILAVKEVPQGKPRRGIIEKLESPLLGNPSCKVGFSTGWESHHKNNPHEEPLKEAAP